MHIPIRRSLAALGVLAVASLALPRVAAAPAPAEAPATPAATAAESRWGEFVEASDTALLLTQPDGTELRARMTEAEIGGALELDGYSIVKGEDGWWRYATRRGPDGLEASSARAGLDARPAGVGPGIGRIAPVWDDGQGGDVRTQLLRQLQTASRQASAKAAAAGEPRVFRFPVVLFATWYDPEPPYNQTSPQFQEGNDVEHYEKILDGFGGNPTGTLTEFYFENSYGQFLVQVDVLAQPDGQPYVSTLSQKPGDDGRCHYGGIDPPEDPLDDLDLLDTVIGAGGGGALGMALELFYGTTLAADHGFADYDNDGDGSIDFMGIIHSGAEMAVTGDPCNTWSHAIAVSSFTGLAGNLVSSLGPDLPIEVPDTSFKAGVPVPPLHPDNLGITFDRLFTMPEFETRQGVLTIGVAAHEMAHALGESDFYGTDGSSSGSGDWDIMSGGSYGGSPSGSNPTWFNPMSRVFQGWVTPTLVHDDVEDYTFQRRSSMPEGYTSDEPNPNLVLVPTRWVEVGEETADGHVWTEEDVYGLVEDGEGRFVIEGWYLELASRMPLRAPGIHEEMTRESYFDRWLYGSGLLTWHFDYWRRFNVLYGQNGGNNDPNRMQMDVEEWDFNDTTQEIALNRNRAEASDVAWDAATGITSGTHRPNASVVDPGDVGEPQAPIAFSSTEDAAIITPLTPYRYEFEVADTPANHTMRVTVNSDLVGDCTLQLFSGEEGAEKAETDLIDTGSFLTPEEAIITDPVPGRWVAEVGDFAGCVSASGTITFEGPSGFDTTGTADTWQNESQEPTGWAFTNIRTDGAEGLSHGTDAGGPGQLTVDILQIVDALDVSPGFVRGAATEAADGRRPINVGADNLLAVEIFSNGDTGGDVEVRVHDGAPDGPVIAEGSVELGAYTSEVFEFEHDPGQEGPFDLYVEVDPTDALGEESEANNLQKSTLWAGPEDPSVLIVDDDGPGDTELVYAGALAALGIPYAIADKHVTAGEMGEYDAVIWASTLDRSDGQIDEQDRISIADHLEGGGRLWLASNRAIEALTTTGQGDFTSTYFGVTSADIDSFYEPVTMATEDILGDGEVAIDVLPGRPFIDKYALAESPYGEPVSLGALTGTGTAGDGSLLGARLDGGTEGGDFQAVVTSFSLSQVAEPGDAIEMVEAVMDHFGVAGGQYAVATADPIVYHSQPRQTVADVDLPVKAIVLGGEDGQPVRLHYRHHGLGDYVPVDLAPSGSAGGYLGHVPAADVTPDGLDYYLKAGAASTYVPRTAEGGSVANAVAVFMPDVVAAPEEPATPEVPETPREPATPAVPSAPTAPADVAGVGSGRLPATGGEALTLLGTALLLGALVLRRLHRLP